MNKKGKILGLALLFVCAFGVALTAVADTPVDKAKAAVAAVNAAEAKNDPLAPAHEGEGENALKTDKPLEGTVVVRSSDDAYSDPYADEAAPAAQETAAEEPAPVATAPSFTLTKDADSQLLTIDAPSEDLRNIIRKVADMYELNIVIPNALNGSTTLKLRNVSWKQLFDVMLPPAGFSYVEDKNIILIKSREEVSAEPTETRVFLINYGTAAELLASITPLVDASAGGRIQVDRRSNALVITERPSRFNNIKEIIEKLDKATPQVLIESKFIDLDDSDAKNLGLDWKSLNSYTLSASGLKRTWSDAHGGDEPGTTYTDTAVFSASQFDVVLGALNTLSGTNLISNPTVVALNNTEATINIGEEYPIPQYSYNQQAGVFEVSGFEYKPIGVNLKVTPQVNNEGFITLKIAPEVSSQGAPVTFGTTNGAEIPIINTRKTSSIITVKDGYTLAIGGLIQNQETPTSSSVPGLSSLPVAGRLFKSEKNTIKKRNLIIFITARTVSPDGSVRETTNPRQLTAMNITASDIPGSQPSVEETEAMQKLNEKREAFKKSAALQKMAAEEAKQPAQAETKSNGRSWFGRR